MKTNRIFLSMIAGLVLSAPVISQAAPGNGTDLAIGKTASTNAAMVGDVLTFQLSVTNLGPASASSATVSDVLPSGLQYSSSTGSGTYNPTTGQWNFTPGAPGNISIMTITVQATNAGTWLNSATISSSFPADTNLLNNTASASVTVTNNNPPIVLTCSSNITVTATGANGATVFFTVTASGGCNPPPFVNAIPPSGSTFPIGTTTVNSTASDTCSNSTNCSFTVTVVAPPISLNCPSNITVTATGPSGATVFFTATASGGCNPPLFVNAIPPSGSTFPIGTTTVTSTASDICGTSTNCSFTVTVVEPPISLNCSSNITVTVTNQNGAVVFFTVTASGGCSPPPFVIANPLSGSTFPSGTTTVLATASDTCGGSTNCSFTVTVNSITNSQSNLQVTKTASTNSVAVGDYVSFYITVTNLGLTTSSNITVRDLLPPGFTFSASSTVCGSVYNPVTGLVTNTTLSAGGGCTLSILALATNAGTFTNTATITSASPPNTNANNSASAIVTVTLPLADLVVTKAVSTNAVGPFTNSVMAQTGQTIYFQLSIANNGPTNANNIVINDLLPPGLAFVSSQQFPYNPSTGVWTIGTLNTNNGIPFMYLTCLCTNVGMFTNTATVPVPGGLSDPNLSNNTASASVTVTLPPADLVLTKAVSTNPAGPYTNAITAFTGQTIYFQIRIQNAGPATPTNIVINDPLPPGLTYVASSSYPYNTNTGVWTIGTLVGNGTYFMYLDCVATNQGTFTNIATVPVPGGVSDPNLSNNTAKASVQVYQVYSISGYVRGCQSNGPAIPQTTVNLSGAASSSTLTDTNGFYVFSNVVAGGTYTLTPTQPGNVFSPASATVTLNANTNLPGFIGSIGQIRGKLSYGTNGAGVVGGLVKLTGAQTRTVMSDANGVYAFTNTPPGNYTVTPVATNAFIYTPTNAAVTISATNCVAQANFTSANRNVLLVALEVVQVIQDWSNSVPLIQSKKTFVRAHLQLPTNGPAVLIQGAKLYGAGQPGSPLTPYAPGRSPDLLVQTTNAAALRGMFNQSLNFELPPSWTAGSFPLQFVATNNVTVIPTNTVSANSSVQVSFIPSSIFQVKFFNMYWTNGAGARLRVDDATMGDLPQRLLSIYPVPSVRARFGVQAVPPSAMKANGTPDLYKVNDMLNAQWVFDWLFVGGSGNQIYYGTFAKAPGVSPLGTALGIPGNVASGFIPVPASQANFYSIDRHTHSHEIGHSMGRPHDVSAALFGTTVSGGKTLALGPPTCTRIVGPTNITYPLFQRVPQPAGPLKPALGPMASGNNALIYGLDTLTLSSAPTVNPVADPNVYFDFMSYCDVVPLDVWASTYTYNAFYNAVTNRFTTTPPPAGGGGPSRAWLFVRGVIDYATNTLQFLPFVKLNTTATNNPPSPPPGGYAVVTYDTLGNIVDVIPFTPDDYAVEEDDDPAGDFLIPVPVTTALRQVQIWDTVNNVLLANIIGSTNTPTVSGVSLASTNGGPFNGSGPLELSWFGSDADPNANLTYLVQYSPDNGASWQTLELDWPGQSSEIDTGNLDASTHAMIRVFASDGFNTSDPAYSSAFTISNHPPVLTVIAPQNGTMFIADQQIALEATADDLQDGPLDGSSVQWSSSRDGLLGYGAVLNLEAGALSEGVHVITVTATDAEGLSSSAQVTIQVLRQPPPALAIQLNGSQIQLSWSSSVTNYVLEGTTSLSSTNWTTMTNLPVAADITQTVTKNLSNTNWFFRLRMP